MIIGWLKAWWHCFRHMHRMETSRIGAHVPWKAIGYDCECGAHFWHSKEHEREYRMIRAFVPTLLGKARD